MSFIRCTSNPEGLYVWHDVSRRIAFTAIGQFDLFASDIVYLDLRSWGQLKRHYRRYLDYPYSGRNVRVAECYTRAGTNVEHPEPKDWLKNKTPLDGRLRLSIKTKGRWRHLYLWPVTYRYMMENAIKQDDRMRGKKVAI